jgi:hypothetical protein
LEFQRGWCEDLSITTISGQLHWQQTLPHPSSCSALRCFRLHLD